MRAFFEFQRPNRVLGIWSVFNILKKIKPDPFILMKCFTLEFLLFANLFSNDSDYETKSQPYTSFRPGINMKAFWLFLVTLKLSLIICRTIYEVSSHNLSKSCSVMIWVYFEHLMLSDFLFRVLHLKIIIRLPQ